MAYTAPKHPVFKQIRDAMQNAEELQGPEGVEYLDVMLETSKLATGNARNFAHINPEFRAHYESRLRQMITQLQMDIAELPPKPVAGPSFSA